MTSVTGLTLLGWRRAVTALYADVRAMVDAGAPGADAHAAWRRGRDELFGAHPDSPIPVSGRADFPGLAYAPYDQGLRWTLPVLPEPDGPEPTVRAVPTGTDGVVRFERRGRVQLPDGLGTLDLWWLLGYGGGLFVPLKDATAGVSTYGGGRYLLDTVKGADLGGAADGSTLVVDLNFAYQPSCAYDPAWACPLASPGNTVAGPVVAGELYEPLRYDQPALLA